MTTVGIKGFTWAMLHEDNIQLSHPRAVRTEIKSRTNILDNSIYIIPTNCVYKVIRTFEHFMPKTKRKFREKRDTSEESGDRRYGFYFNNGVEDIDRKRARERDTRARWRWRGFGISSCVDGKGDLTERPTCLQKL